MAITKGFGQIADHALRARNINRPGKTKRAAF